MQNILDEFAKSIDPRTSVFDVKIDSETDSTVALSGRVLDFAQLDQLQRRVSTELNASFPSRKLDTASIRILNAGTHAPARVHVATNLTGVYEKPTFGMPLSSELCYGTMLEVLDENGNWVFTRQPDGYLGWAYRPYLNEGNSSGAASHFVLAPAIELREESNGSSRVVTRLVSGTVVSLVEERGDWSLVNANKTGWLPSASLRDMADIPTSIEEKRELIVADAQRMTGIPYLWGGMSGNGIDCSGLARLLHRWIGVSIPRDADMQHKAAFPVEPPYEVGDLFFFAEDDSKRNISHVGISLGGWEMIHSSRSRNGVYVDNIQEAKYLKDIFVSAGSFLR